jgi:hypothetical protein
MRFIEELFGVSPDRGSGALEFLFLFIPICGIVWLIGRRAVIRKS